MPTESQKVAENMLVHLLGRSWRHTGVVSSFVLKLSAGSCSEAGLSYEQLRTASIKGKNGLRGEGRRERVESNP